ncbi:EexN family lipoprotein [Thioalkalivibrio versutus]|uniref:EexN family lipoprotein n=1 Tax=Thioalkalivibrio versutus TaxID=106634 RepID=UPI000AD66BA9|nr:EexN family lipoprotein [Thioalkalivibrio versutus]
MEATDVTISPKVRSLLSVNRKSSRNAPELRESLLGGYIKRFVFIAITATLVQMLSGCTKSVEQWEEDIESAYEMINNCIGESHEITENCSNAYRATQNYEGAQRREERQNRAALRQENKRLDQKMFDQELARFRGMPYPDFYSYDCEGIEPCEKAFDEIEREKRRSFTKQLMKTWSWQSVSNGGYAAPLHISEYYKKYCEGINHNKMMCELQRGIRDAYYESYKERQSAAFIQYREDRTMLQSVHNECVEKLSNSNNENIDSLSWPSSLLRQVIHGNTEWEECLHACSFAREELNFGRACTSKIK